MFQTDGAERSLQLLNELQIQFQYSARELPSLHVWLQHVDDSEVPGFNDFKIHQEVHLTHRLGHGDGSLTQIFISHARAEGQFERLCHRAGSLLQTLPSALLPPGVPLANDFGVESALWIEYVFGVAWMRLSGIAARSEQRINVGGIYVRRAIDEILAASKVWKFGPEMKELVSAARKGKLPLSHASELSDFFHASLEALSFLKSQIQWLFSESDDALVVALRSLLRRLELDPSSVLTTSANSRDGFDAQRINRLCKACRLAEGSVITVDFDKPSRPILAIDWIGLDEAVKIAIPDSRRSTPSERFRAYLVEQFRDLLCARLLQLNQAGHQPILRKAPRAHPEEGAFMVNDHRIEWKGSTYFCSLTPKQVRILTVLLQRDSCSIEDVMNRSPDAIWKEKYKGERRQRQRISKELGRLNDRIFAIKPKNPPFHFELPRSLDELRRVDCDEDGESSDVVITSSSGRQD